MEKIKITGNESSMPTIGSKNHGSAELEILTESPGMTIRLELAKAAMEGMCANPEFYRLASEKLEPKDIADFYAVVAVEQADALIKAYNQ